MTNCAGETTMADEARRDLKDARQWTTDPENSMACSLQSIAASLIEIRECLSRLAYPVHPALKNINVL